MKTTEVIKIMRQQRTPEQMEKFKKMLKNKIIQLELEKCKIVSSYNFNNPFELKYYQENDSKIKNALRLQLEFELEEICHY